MISPIPLAPFATWERVLEYARTGAPLYYRAPLDLRPTRLIPAVPGDPRVPYTYQARARTLRIFPPGCVGQGRYRTADPFTADRAHLDRLFRPATPAEVAAPSPAPRPPSAPDYADPNASPTEFDGYGRSDEFLE